MQDLADSIGSESGYIARGVETAARYLCKLYRLPSQAERLAWLAERLATLPGHGIIYTLTVRDANSVSDWLKSCGFNVEAYTGETGDGREQLEQALL